MTDQPWDDPPPPLPDAEFDALEESGRMQARLNLLAQKFKWNMIYVEIPDITRGTHYAGSGYWGYIEWKQR